MNNDYFVYAVILQRFIQSSTMSGNPAVDVRIDMINGMFDRDQDTLDFMKLAQTECAAMATKLNAARPATIDVGRFIAALDHIQYVKNLLCDAAILGKELENRKKRKVDTSTDTKK